MPLSRIYASILTILAITPLLAFATATLGNQSTIDTEKNTGLRSAKGPTQERSSVSDLVLRGPFTPSMTPESTQRDANVCRAWDYKATSLKEDLLSMRKLSASDWGRYCYQYACSMNGDAELEGLKYRIEINAGGWIALAAPDGTIKYWATSKKLPRFLAGCDCCE